MKKITVIRHAQSKFNTGTCKPEELPNCRITDHGKEQASHLHHKFDILVLSPLKRSIETYVHSGIQVGKVEISDLFRECMDDSGRLNFLELEEQRQENYEQVVERARKAIKYICSLPENNIGIISHGIFIWHFLNQLGLQPVSTYNTQSLTFMIDVNHVKVD